MRPEGGAAKGRNVERSNLTSQSQTTISYINEFEAELLKRLNGNEDEASIVRWVSEKVLESYRNGITAGQKGEQVIRKGESRRRGMMPRR